MQEKLGVWEEPGGGEPWGVRMTGGAEGAGEAEMATRTMGSSGVERAGGRGRVQGASLEEGGGR